MNFENKLKHKKCWTCRTIERAEHMVLTLRACGYIIEDPDYDEDTDQWFIIYWEEKEV